MFGSFPLVWQHLDKTTRISLNRKLCGRFEKVPHSISQPNHCHCGDIGFRTLSKHLKHDLGLQKSVTLFLRIVVLLFHPKGAKLKRGRQSYSDEVN